MKALLQYKLYRLDQNGWLYEQYSYLFLPELLFFWNLYINLFVLVWGGRDIVGCSKNENLIFYP